MGCTSRLRDAGRRVADLEMLVAGQRARLDACEEHRSRLQQWHKDTEVQHEERESTRRKIGDVVSALAVSGHKASERKLRPGLGPCMHTQNGQPPEAATWTHWLPPRSGGLKTR